MGLPGKLAMKILQGPISRQIIFAFSGISLLAVIAMIYSSLIARGNESLMQEVGKRSQLALLSAQIRSECLTLTDMVEMYVYHSGSESMTRNEIEIQTHKLDQLIQQAISSINPSDVDESLALGNIRQGLLSFNTQAGRVLSAYDVALSLDESTNRELVILVENYQIPLIKSLEQFESYETRQAATLLERANQNTRQLAHILATIAALITVTAIILVAQVITRYVIPLSLLREGVEEIGSGRLDWRIRLESKDEMGQLARALNKMSGELLESRQRLESYATTLEEQVRTRTAELRKLTIAIEQSPSSVIITDTAGRIEYVNPAFSDLTGYSQEEVIGQNPRFLKSDLTPYETYANLWGTIKAGNIWRGELINKKKNGDLYWEGVTITPAKDPEGRVSHFIAIKEDITHRKKDEEELRRLAQLDPLTGLFNRRQLYVRGEQVIQDSLKKNHRVGILMMDIDHFKAVNDTHTHAVGDEVLRAVAAQIHACIRPDDIATRYGGEEFCLILPHIQPDAALGIAERIRRNVEGSEFETSRGKLRVTLSIGLFMFPGEGWNEHETFEEHIHKADLALYRAKQTGRNKVVVYNSDWTLPHTLAQKD